MSLRKFTGYGKLYLVNQRKIHIEIVRNGCCSLRTTGIRANDDSLLEVGNILLDVPFEKRFSIQIIDRNVKITLILRVVQIHRYDMVGPVHKSEICYKRSSLRNPLLINLVWPGKNSWRSWKELLGRDNRGL